MTIKLPCYVKAVEVEDIGYERHIRIVYNSPIRLLQAIRDAFIDTLKGK